MNRNKLVFLTGLTLAFGPISAGNGLLTNSNINEVDAAQLKLDLNPSKKYPNIAKTLDLTSMAQYTSENLFMNVTLNNFYVKDVGVDKNNHYLVLLTPIKTSNQYFLMTLDSDFKIKQGQKLTVQGFINGKDRLSAEQIATGLNSRYLNKKVVSMLPDNFSIN